MSDSETEVDSDNEDVTRDDDVNAGEDDDDWVDLKSADPSASSPVDAASVRVPCCHSLAVVECNSRSWRVPTYLR